MEKKPTLYEFSCFFREVDEDCVLLGQYAVSFVNFSPFQDNLSVTSSGVKNPKVFKLFPEDGTYKMTRNVGKKLLPLAV